jgi:hypothetical protein
VYDIENLSNVPDRGSDPDRGRYLRYEDATKAPVTGLSTTYKFLK